MIEIRTRLQGGTPFFSNMLNNGNVEVCLKEDVDKAIAEKDKEIALLKERICNGDVSRLTWIDDCIAKDNEIEELKAKLRDHCIHCPVKEQEDDVVAELKQKLESVQASMYADVVDANMENRRLRRALYKACACYADIMQKRYIECKCDGWVHRVDKWFEVERRCLKKAEDYK